MRAGQKRTPPSLAEIQGRALEELRRRGFAVDDAVADGSVHRCPTDDRPSDKSGWYVLHADEWPTLVLGKWHEGEEQETVPLWKDADKPLSLEERRACEAAMKRQKQAREAETRRRHEDAAVKAKADLDKATDADNGFPYLARKGVDATPGLKVKPCRHPKKANDAPLEDALLVPLSNAMGEVRSYQRIFADGFKANMAGGDKTGVFYEFPGQGANSSFTILCEGWATSATVSRAAQGATVLSVCDRLNFGPVLKGLRDAGRLDPSRTLIVADNDWETAQRLYLEAKGNGKAKGKTVADYNPGAQAAMRAAKTYGCRWVLAVPDEAIYPTGETATDANDLYLAKRGDCLQAGIAPEEADRIAVDTVRGMLDRGWGREDEPPKEPPKPPMQFITFGEATQLTAPAELVRGVLPAVGIGYLFGPSGTFKTFIAMQIGLHVSQGWPLAGHKAKRRPVYYLLLEGGAGLGKRTRALNNWRTSIGRELAPDTAYMFWPQPFSIATPASVDALIATVNGAGHKGALIVIDTQSQAAEGLDEDKAADATRILGAAKRISEAVEGVVLLVHHTGKEESRGLRGSSAQKANVDFSLEVERLPGSRRAVLKTSKEKDNADDRAISFDLKVWEVGTDDDGEPVTSCVAVPLEGVVHKPRPRLPSSLARALDTLRQALQIHGADRVTLEEWRDVYLSKSTGSTMNSKRAMFSSDRRALVEAGFVEVENDTYWIPQEEVQDA